MNPLITMKKKEKKIKEELNVKKKEDNLNQSKRQEQGSDQTKSNIIQVCIIDIIRNQHNTSFTLTCLRQERLLSWTIDRAVGSVRRPKNKKLAFEQPS